MYIIILVWKRFTLQPENTKKFFRMDLHLVPVKKKKQVSQMLSTHVFQEPFKNLFNHYGIYYISMFSVHSINTENLTRYIDSTLLA